MSVPVRYSAAASLEDFAVVNSGLSSLQQEEQHYDHRQRYQEGQFFGGEKVVFENENRLRYLQPLFPNQHHHQQQQPQQQQMEQQPEMVSPTTITVAMSTTSNNNHINMTSANIPINSAPLDVGSASGSSSHCHYNDGEMMMSTTPPMDAGATMMEAEVEGVEATVTATVMAAADDGSSSGNDNDEWMLPEDDGGRLGTPGAAGLYDAQHKKQHHTSGPSLMENEKQFNGKKSTSSSNTASSSSSSRSSSSSSSSKSSLSANNNSNISSPGPSSSSSRSSKSAAHPISNIQLQREIFENELFAMTTEEIHNALREYDALQDKYHTPLILPRESRREVTAGGRDGSAYILRCIKMFYDLPSDVLFSAMCLVDRFLDRMAVKPKHMACLTVASFYLTIKQLGLKSISAEELVTISQCGCSAGDLERMAGVIDNKLGMQVGYAPVTSVNFLRLYYCLFRNMARELHAEFYNFYVNIVKLQDMENRLENLMCDVRTSVVRPATMALVVFCLHLDKTIKESYPKGRPELLDVFNYIMVVQRFMKIPDRKLNDGFNTIADLLSHYNAQNKQPYKQRLTWRLSSRTMRVLRPTNRFSSALSTIEETNPTIIDDGCRSRTESISSEEEEDWPTSPIIPIFEQC